MANNILTMSIADIPVSLQYDDCDTTARAFITERYAPFVVSSQSVQATIQVHTEPGERFVPLHASRIYQVRTHRVNNRIEFESHYEKGWFDLETRLGDLVMRPSGNTENYLRVLYAWLGLDQDMLLLHASGIISNGRGYVFYGPSGSGKTTITHLSTGRIVLSDDIVIVKKVDGVYRVYGVPFRGNYPEAPRTNNSATLKGLCILVKAPEHRLELLPVSIAVARLTACVPFVMTQPGNPERVMRMCADLAASVTPRALYFRKDADFWRLLDGLE